MITTIAAAQLQSDADPRKNLEHALETIEQAKARGAKLIIFPEIFMALLTKDNFRAAYAHDVSQALDGFYVQGLCEAARQHDCWIVSGMLETADQTLATQDVQGAYNTTVVIDNHGTLISAYRKTHMYDAFGFRESAVFASGEQLFRPIETPFGRMGLFVCYELRFPEIARQQSMHGVDFFVMPSAWVAGPLKEMHWRQLVTARAIENTAYMLTCDQVGNNYIGRSLLVDPLGVVLAEGTEGECVVYGEIDTRRLAQVRERVPVLQHRRPELF
jgi:predicted amidohydrolase